MALHPEKWKHLFPKQAPVAWNPACLPKDNEDWYRDLVEHSHDLLCVHDLQGQLLSVNPVPARLLGYSVEEMLRMRLQDVIDPQYRAEVDDYRREIERVGHSLGLMTVVTRTGEKRLWEYRSSLRTEGVEAPIVRVIAHDATDRVRAEKALRLSNEELLRTAQARERMMGELTLFRTLLDQSHDAIQVIEPETLRLLDVNERTCVQLGYSRQELLSMTIYDISPGFDQSVRADVLRRLRESGFAMFERVQQRKDGSTFPVEVTLREVLLDRTYGIAITRNISERKRAEEILHAKHQELNLFRALLDRSNDAIEVLDPQTLRFLDVNERACAELGYSREELLSMTVYDIDPEYDESSRQWVQQQLCERGYAVLARKHRRKDGTRLPVEVSVRRVRLDREYGVAVARNVTEREQSDERLREYEKVIEGLDELIIVVDRNYRYVIANRAFLEYRGLSKEQVIGRSVEENLDPETFERLIKKKMDECFSGKVVHYEMRYKYPNLGDRDLYISYFPIEGANGVDRIAIILKDVTERKRDEERRREYERVVEGLEEMIVVVDRDYHLVLANRTYLQYRSLPRDQVIGHRLSEVVGNDFFERVIKEKMDESFTGKIVRYEKKDTYPSLGERDVSVTYFPIEGPRGVDRLAVVLKDITERKAAELALQQAESRAESILDSMSDSHVSFDRDWRHVYVNRAAADAVGMTREQILGRNMWELFPDLVGTELERQGRRAMGLRIPADFDFYYPRRQCWWDVRLYPTALGLSLFITDITERKRAEEALRESEARERARAKELETVLEVVPVAVCIAHDAECRRITGNRAAHEQMRVPAGKDISKSAPPEDQPAFRLLQDGVEIPLDLMPMQQAAATRLPVYGRAVTIAFEDGTQRETLVNVVPLLDEQGKPRGVAGASIDLTELKQTEQALRESELRFRTVYERSPVGICLVDSRSWSILQVNPKFCEIAGRGEQELLGLNVASITHPDDVAQGNEYRQQVEDEKLTSYETEKRYVRPDGTLRWVRIRVVPMWSKGETRRWQMGLVEDITERRQAEEALRKSEERFRVALKNSPIAVFDQDRDLRYTWSYNSQLGLSANDKLGKTMEEIYDPESAAQAIEVRRQVLETGIGVRREMHVTFGGRKRYLDTTIEPVRDAEGAVIGITGAAMDITELRETSEGLREAKKKLTEEKLYLEQEIDTELGFGEIIGQSQALQRVMEQVSKVAASDATVLLMGETGTGKELVARAIHRLSLRAKNSFIKMNCAAIPSGLLESELFGNEKGAFTGAVSKKIGRLELADKGTLFLDEIGEISLALQPKLLRVLQDREFERLGGTQTLKVDFRLIAATNRNLADWVRDKEFRSDLYYRLNVFPIRVPPLRERREDIHLLVEHFVQKVSLRMKKAITSIPKKTMDALMEWDWPGNVRELENFIERSVILTNGSVLVASPMDLRPIAAEESGGGDQTLEAAEREHILHALRESRGQIGGLGGAAMRLGLKRTTLQSKLKHLGIDPRSTY